MEVGTSCMKYRHDCTINSPERFLTPDVKINPFEITAIHRRNVLITQSLFWGALVTVRKNCDIVTYQFILAFFQTLETLSMMLFRQDASVVLWGKTPN